MCVGQNSNLEHTPAQPTECWTAQLALLSPARSGVYSFTGSGQLALHT